jgi:hypothetical protein
LGGGRFLHPDIDQGHLLNSTLGLF